MFAFLTVALFTIAAMSVDLGNAIARRTDTQSQADYGAFAAASQQLETAKAGMAISAAMKNAVVTAMNNNQPQDDKSTCWTTKTCVTRRPARSTATCSTVRSATAPEWAAAPATPRPSRVSR